MSAGSTSVRAEPVDHDEVDVRALRRRGGAAASRRAQGALGSGGRAWAIDVDATHATGAQTHVSVPLNVVKGRAPIVLVAPHGGRRDTERRPWGSVPLKMNDLHTAALAHDLAARLDASAL